MPLPLLENTQVHLIGHIRRNEIREIDYDALILPLYSKGKIAAYLSRRAFSAFRRHT